MSSFLDTHTVYKDFTRTPCKAVSDEVEVPENEVCFRAGIVTLDIPEFT